MRDWLSWVALPLLAAGCAAPLPNYEGNYEEGAAAGIADSPPATLAVAGPVFQEEDYSPSGMFMSAHGDFMLKRQRFRPMVSADVLYQPNSNIKSEPGEFNLIHYRADARVPIAIDPDSYVELGGYFGARDYNTSSDFPVTDETLYDIGLYLGGGGFVNDDLLIEGTFFPGIYSDLDGTLTSDDYQWFVEAQAVWRTQEDLFWKFGVAHDGLFKDVEVYPLLGVSYAINTQWRLDVLLPRSLELSFSPNAETILLADLTLEGNQYEVHPTAGNGSSSTTSVQEMRVGLGAVYRFNDMWSLYGKFGATIAGDYELSNGNGVFADGTLEPAIFFRLGLGIDF